jgi:AraC family transcriptional regulator, transcriptional activator of pobA
MKHYKHLSDLHRDSGWPPPENPLFSIGRCTDACTIGNQEFTSDFYAIGLKKLRSGVILYGRTKYDHDNGSVLFAAPRQVLEFKNLEFEEDGFIILIHEDFLSGHSMHSEIKNYGFFEYEVNEALHLSPKEEQIMWELYEKIRTEYHNNPDEFSREIILTHIDSILKYSQRFYKRQFINREPLNARTASKFNQALAEWSTNVLTSESLPTVNAIATSMHLSPRYLSDLLKEETGKTAIELIHIFLIREAKNLLKASDNSVSETAYKLGFENLPYFSRLFKKEVGVSPNQFKKQLLN